MSSNLRGKKVVVFGGNGFIGSHLVNHLCEEACEIKIVTKQKKPKKKRFFLQVNPAKFHLKKLSMNSQPLIKQLVITILFLI